MENTLYTPEKKKESLRLTEDQKNAVRGITLGIEEVDETILEMAVEDVIHTLENGHPLNRVISSAEGSTSGYIACEDFVPREAYIKYLGTTKQTGRNLLKEIPAFLDYAKSLGYTKLNFHGWNERLNHILTRYGFERIRTDKMGECAVNFYEKTLTEEKSPEAVEKERINAFEQKYLSKIDQEYQQTLATFSQDTRQSKERAIAGASQALSTRLAEVEGFEFADRQKAILKLKLARHFQTNDTCDLNTLFDALIETPKFINTDKGSFHRLLEVHQQKQYQIIAERMKKRAEMGDTEAFNPYENLFTTKSGEYHVVRLLNLPHLEKESEYMKHCVGNSDSYINKMKRGDVEIFSFRYSPTLNTGVQKLEEDIPIMTIEYNVRTKTIEQMKEYDDGFLDKRVPYFDDVIDALKQLRTTRTDTGELRDFTKISPSELENIDVKDEYLLTEKGEVHFRDFNPNEGTFILKMGAMEIISETSKEDAVKMLKIVDNIDCAPSQVATNQNEVTENTKAYIGPLFPGIFAKNIEHIYTSFPEGKIPRFELSVRPLSKEQALSEYKKSSERTWVWPELEKNMPYTSPKAEALDVFIMNFGKAISSDDALAEMDRLGVRPLTYEELIQYGIAYPREQEKNLLVALGSKHSLDGRPLAPDLGFDGGVRDLCASRWGREWDDRCRFPVVRK